MASRSKSLHDKRGIRVRLAYRVAVSALVLLSAAAWAQTGKEPSVTMAAVPLVTAPRAAQTMVNLDFRVPHGYHINSNIPKSEFLIPTVLKMSVPTDIILGKIV